MVLALVFELVTVAEMLVPGFRLPYWGATQILAAPVTGSRPAK